MRDVEYLARSEEFDALANAHGGYWRHGFTDHSYLYNLYFPPERFFDQLKREIHALVSSYPVSQDILAGWVGELIDQPADRIVVGNGAAELIKIVATQVAKKLIVPVPSFNEYINAAPAGAVREFALSTPSFELDVDEFAAEAIGFGADVAVVVTPNNPTSLSVTKADLLRLAVTLNEHGCILIVDESFIDFASDRDYKTLERDIASYPNLVIFKSMSKAYGICGIRLGYMLTANREFATQVRAGVPIWNVNGFAEAFLKVAPEFRAEFEASCAQVRADRDQLYRQLRSVEGLTAYEPDANYVLCRVPASAPRGQEIARQLFVEDNLFIKHCGGKSMVDAERYIRLASRTQAENSQLADALARACASAPDTSSLAAVRTGGRS